MLRTLLHKSWRLLYGAYSLTALAVLVTFAALMALLVPRLAWRRTGAFPAPSEGLQERPHAPRKLAPPEEA